LSFIEHSKIELIIYKYPDINLDWLITGEGAMLKDTSSQSSSIEEFLRTENKILNARIEELNREIGRLENELKNK